MALARPFVTHKFTAYAGDTSTSTVSLVVWVIDEFTGRHPEIGVSVSLKGLRQKPIKNRSGYYCFTDLDKGDYTIVVQSDPARLDWYFTKEVDVKIPMGNRLAPVQEVTLSPNLSYPFPNHITLVRGFVMEREGSNTKPLSNIPVYRLKLGDDEKKLVETKTTHNGEFALYIKNFELEDDQNGMEVTIEADKGDAKGRRTFSILKEGTTVTIKVEFMV